MKRLAAILLASALLSGVALGQGQVTTVPLGVTSVVSNGSVGVTYTFQQAIAASTNRKGCVVQNTGSNTLYVYPGSISSATTPGSIQLTNKQTFDCTKGGIVAQDAINVTGTSGDNYVTVRQ